MISGELTFPTSLCGTEIRPGVFLIGKPIPRPDLGPNKMSCLANVDGALCIIELSVSFSVSESKL